MHDRPAPGGEFLQRDLLLRVLADDGRDVADLHFESARVDDREVHLHEARDRATLASKQHVRLATNSHAAPHAIGVPDPEDRKSTRLNSSHDQISYAVFCLKKKKKKLHSTLSLKKKNKNNNIN